MAATAKIVPMSASRNITVILRRSVNRINNVGADGFEFASRAIGPTLEEAERTESKSA
jgi:hypothetical protein